MLLKSTSLKMEITNYSEDAKEIEK